jgi:uncharacterized membrane protein YphA (DoxX/SURF4 family)
VPRSFARLVSFSEVSTELALVFGVLTRVSAAAAILMVLNFHIASGALFQYRVLTSGCGLPVLGGLFALALGAISLPLSLDRFGRRSR